MYADMDILKPIGNGKYKVNYGSCTESSFEWACETSNDIEEFDIWVELKCLEDVQKLKKLFQLKGSNVKKLFWCNWGKYEVPASEFVEILNCLTNLKFMKLSSWYTKFSGEFTSGSVNLPNLSCLEINECNNLILDVLSSIIPENKFKCVKIYNVSDPDAKFSNFTKKQSTLKRLNICGDYKTVDTFKDLQLERLRCILQQKDGEEEDQSKFLAELIKSQKELADLDLMNDLDCAFNFVNESILEEICALSKLKTLYICVDGIAKNAIKSISNLKHLEKLELKTNRDSSLPLFQEISSIQNDSLESLVLNLWSFEIPAQTYTAFGKNYKNLKSLTITLGTKHKISFFAHAFPNVEEMSIKFGEANHPVNFSEIFDMKSEVKESKLEKLDLVFTGHDSIDVEKFYQFLETFKNLEYLSINSKFPFAADFVKELSKKLNNIKVLKLNYFDIVNRETFPAEIIDAFKDLRSKLKYVKLCFSNIQRVNLGHGPMTIPGEQVEFHNFSFRPFIDALKDFYTPEECSMANIRIHNNLQLTAGNEDQN